MSKELKIDQSISHNGVCLTVVQVESDEQDGTWGGVHNAKLDALGETGLRVRSGPRDGAAPVLRSGRVRPRDVDVRVEGRVGSFPISVGVATSLAARRSHPVAGPSWPATIRWLPIHMAVRAAPTRSPRSISRGRSPGRSSAR